MWPAPVENRESLDPCPKLGPAVLHVGCGIRGQGLRLVVPNIATASLGVVQACGYTFRGFRNNLLHLRIILSCGIHSYMHGSALSGMTVLSPGVSR